MDIPFWLPFLTCYPLRHLWGSACISRSLCLCPECLSSSSCGSVGGVRRPALPRWRLRPGSLRVLCAHDYSSLWSWWWSVAFESCWPVLVGTVEGKSWRSEPRCYFLSFSPWRLSPLSSDLNDRWHCWVAGGQLGQLLVAWLVLMAQQSWLFSDCPLSFYQFVLLPACQSQNLTGLEHTSRGLGCPWSCVWWEPVCVCARTHVCKGLSGSSRLGGSLRRTDPIA